MPSTGTDVIVIGAGLSGLTAAALLAKRGLKVLGAGAQLHARRRMRGHTQERSHV